MASDDEYEIKMETRGEYLLVMVGGQKLTADIAVSYWNEIANACEERSVTKVLIEKDFPLSVGPAEMVRMADHVGNILPGRKIAFCDRYSHESINELGKKLARNRQVMMQLFDNVQDAERWLLAN